MITRNIILMTFCFGLTFPTQGQILKKLKKRAEQAAERTILRKTDEAVSKKTEKVIDNVTAPNTNKPQTKTDSVSDDEKAKRMMDILLSQTPSDAENGSTKGHTTPMGKPTPAPPNNNVKLPEAYHFTYQATLEIKNKNGQLENEYLLQPNESFYAQKKYSKNLTNYVVYDNQLNTEVYFINLNGKKRTARKKMDFITQAKMVGAYRDAQGKKIAPLGKKEILGFNCEGYKIETDAGATELWVTNEAPATMFGTLFAHRSDGPNSPFSANTMIMKLVHVSKESSDESYQMECTEFKQKETVFTLANYNE